MTHCCAADLAAKAKELSDVAAERNKARSEAAAAGRTADKLTAQIAAMPKVRLAMQPASLLLQSLASLGLP